LNNIGTELESSAENSDIVRNEIDSVKFPGLSDMEETVFLEVVELIAEHSEMIIAHIFLEDTQSLL